MDQILTSLKNSLNHMEDKYVKQPGPNIDTKMINYFMRTKDKEDLQSLVSYDDINEDSDDDDSSLEEGNLEEDMLSDDEESISNTNNISNKKDDERCGASPRNATSACLLEVLHDSLSTNKWYDGLLQLTRSRVFESSLIVGTSGTGTIKGCSIDCPALYS
jgi:hypothetical protein